MIKFKYELDSYPQVCNRSIVQITPTKLYIDWLDFIIENQSSHTISNLEPISFLIEDFNDQNEFENWLSLNFSIMFEIRLNYSCIDKSKWPELRTLNVFKEWFNIKQSNLILDLEDEPIKII